MLVHTKAIRLLTTPPTRFATLFSARRDCVAIHYSLSIFDIDAIARSAREEPVTCMWMRYQKCIMCVCTRTASSLSITRNPYSSNQRSYAKSILVQGTRCHAALQHASSASFLALPAHKPLHCSVHATCPPQDGLNTHWHHVHPINPPGV
jgi:hypothetical protein